MPRGILFIACVLLLVHLSLGGFKNADIRLAGGKTTHDGRVEIFYDGEWGTVCDDMWDIKEAQVVCRQLKFPGARAAVDGGAVYGPGVGTVLMDDLNCLGTETDLSQCIFTGWGVANCGHGEDAGVVCDEPLALNVSREYFVKNSARTSELLGELFDSGRDCDLMVSVVVENNIVETICAHKLIIFLEPKVSSLGSSQAKLSIEVSRKCQPFVVQFVSGQMNISVTSAKCVHKLASDWGIKVLQEDAGKMLTWLLPVDPTFAAQSSLFDYAFSTGDELLQESCLHYLAWNCEALVASAAWTGLSVPAVKGLLSRADLTVPSEYFVVRALEKWEKAQGKAFALQQFDLLKHIRFPMISAEDLHQLKDPRYQAGKLQGFEFNALSIGTLLDVLVNQSESYAPRIYTGKPWSFTFSLEEVEIFKRTGFYVNQHQRDNLSVTFRTPMHSSAYFVLVSEMSWHTRLYLRSDECSNITVGGCPSASLSSGKNNSALPAVFKNDVVYKNKLVLRCDGQYVTHIQDFYPAEEIIIAANKGLGQTYPCVSNQYSYTMVIRPMYRTGLNSTEVDMD